MVPTLLPRFFKVTWGELSPPAEASIVSKSAYVVAKMPNGTYVRVSAAPFEATRDIIAPPYPGADRTYVADASSTDAYFATLGRREQVMKRASDASVTYGGTDAVVFAEDSLIFEPLRVPGYRCPPGRAGVPFVQDSKGILRPIIASTGEPLWRAPWTDDKTKISLDHARDMSERFVHPPYQVLDPYGDIRWLSESDRVVATAGDLITRSYIAAYMLPVELKQEAEKLVAAEVVLDPLLMFSPTRAMEARPGDGLI